MFCQKCGTQLQEGARFCPNCGFENVAGSVQNAQPSQNQVQPVQDQSAAAPVQRPIQAATPVQPFALPEKKSKKTGVVIGAIVGGVVVIILIIVLLVVLLGKGGGKPSGETDSYNNGSFGSYENTPADDANAGNTDSRISKDYHSGEIIIDGDLIALPMKASDLMALGWMPEDYDADYVIEAKADRYDGEWKSEIRADFKKGSNTIDVSICNRTNQDIKLADGYVNSLITNEDSGYSVMIPGGFETKSSTRDEIISAWGKPYSERSINDEEYECQYEIDDYAGYTLYFFNDTDVLVGAQIHDYDKASVPTSPDRIDTINLDAAKALKDKDSFEVKVTQMQIAEGYYNSGNINFVGNDAFVFTIANNGDKDLTGVDILVVGYKEDGELVKIKSGISVPVLGSDKFITVITNEGDLSIKSGEEENLALKCDARDYYGAEALIYSYTDANGQKHENPLAQEWFDSIYER